MASSVLKRKLEELLSSRSRKTRKTSTCDFIVLPQEDPSHYGCQKRKLESVQSNENQEYSPKKARWASSSPLDMHSPRTLKASLKRRMEEECLSERSAKISKTISTPTSTPQDNASLSQPSSPASSFSGFVATFMPLELINAASQMASDIFSVLNCCQNDEPSPASSSSLPHQPTSSQPSLSSPEPEPQHVTWTLSGDCNTPVKCTHSGTELCCTRTHTRTCTSLSLSVSTMVCSSGHVVY